MTNETPKSGAAQSDGAVKSVVLAAVAGAVLINVYLAISEVGIFHVATAQQLSQWDWSNVAGAAAFQGGWRTAALGFFLHLTVSAVWAAIAVLCARNVKALGAHPIVWGFFYGLIVMAIMRWGVVPLGHAMKPHAKPVWMLNLVIAHTLFFGIPVAWVASRAAKNRLLNA